MTNDSNYNWLKCPQPNPKASLRLFCFPYAGGSASIFRTWSDSLPASVEVCPIELPGRGNRLTQTPLTRLNPLVEAIATAILPYLDLPFALFGHSMGALVSFELARLLRNKYNISPVYLFVSGYRAPQICDRNPPIHTLPEPAFIEELRRLNGTPKAVLENSELLQLVLPTVRADFETIETYIYQDRPPLECAIAAFGGLSDTETSIDELKAWANQTTASFSLQMLVGDHFFLYSAKSQMLQSVAQHLQRCC